MENQAVLKQFNVKKISSPFRKILVLSFVLFLLFFLIEVVFIRLGEKSTREAVCKGAINEAECMTSI